MTENEKPVSRDFIRQIIDEDLRKNSHGGRIRTRFPPEPNGYLHIGHAKSICLNFGLAKEYGGVCNLRFDDTNPAKEDVEYVDSIRDDVRWLGFDWAGEYLRLGLFRGALRLRRVPDRDRQGLRVRPDRRGDPRVPRHTLRARPGPAPTATAASTRTSTSSRACAPANSPTAPGYLRAKIDMASPNMNMRDPPLYRIRRVQHHRTGDAWLHLSDLRLRPLPIGRHRRHHPFHLHPGVREQPRLYDWVAGQPWTGRPRRINTSSPG